MGVKNVLTLKLQLIKEIQISRQTTIFGQTKGYFKREKNEYIGTGERTTLHKIKMVVFLLKVSGTMTHFSSRNTSLKRHNDVFRDEKGVIAPHTLIKKNTILILCNFVLAPVPIHSFISRLKYP